jgi:hypothetical protein
MYNIGGLEAMGEYYSIKNDNNLTSGSETSNAYYGLLTYTFADKWGPYFLYEKMDIKAADPYFSALGSSDVTKTHGGLRYDISYRSSVKAEVSHVKWASDDWNQYDVQWGLAF